MKNESVRWQSSLTLRLECVTCGKTLLEHSSGLQAERSCLSFARNRGWEIVEEWETARCPACSSANLTTVVKTQC